MFKFANKLKQDQSGTLVLLAILIMGTVVVTAVIVSRLITREVRLSHDIENALLALYSAESGIEYGLFDTFVNDKEASDITGGYGTLSNDATWSLKAAETTTEIVKETIQRDTDLTLELYDNTATNSAAGLAGLNIEWNAGSTLRVLTREWDGATLADAVTNDYTCSVTPCPPVFVILNPANAYYVELIAVNDDINDIKITSSPNGTLMTIPLTIDVTGRYSSSSEAMEVRIPRTAPWG